MKTSLPAALILLLASIVGAAETTRYTAWVNGGHDQAGHLTVKHAGNRFTIDYRYKNNGRGPELTEEFTLDEDGTLASYLVKGVSTYGAVVDETFSRNAATAIWKTAADEGKQPLAGPALYWPLYGTPAKFSAAFAALAKRPNGKIPMIPSGVLSWRKLVDQPVMKGAEKRAISLVELTGIGFTPLLVWTTNDQPPRLFAHIEPGSYQLIEDGWEQNATVLEQRQVAKEQELLVEMSKRVAHSLPGKTLISNVRVFDSEHAVVRRPQDVLLENGRIVAINTAGELQPAADHKIDATGRVLLPGLFDMHVHSDFWGGGLHLAAGVTTVRDMGTDNAKLQQIIAREEAGTLLAPRIVPTGFIEGESPSASRREFVIKDLAEAKQAVDWYHEHHYLQIKIYNSFPKDILREVAQYAHDRGIRVGGHIPVFLRAEEAVAQGYDEIQHINQVLLNFLVDDKTDTRTLARFYLPAEKVADLDFDSKRVQDFIALLAERQIVVDPTLTAFNFIRHRNGVLSQAYTTIADHLPPDVRRDCLQAQMKIPNDETAARYEKSFAKMIEFTGRMYHAGIPLVAGTDDLAGFSLHRELEFYVEAGLTPSQALQIATFNGAKYARVLDDRGVIMRGKRADLILTDGDPTQNISDIRKVALVIKGDVAYYPDEIHETVGVKPFAARLEIR